MTDYPQKPDAIITHTQKEQQILKFWLENAKPNDCFCCFQGRIFGFWQNKQIKG